MVDHLPGVELRIDLEEVHRTGLGAAALRTVQEAGEHQTVPVVAVHHIARVEAPHTVLVEALRIVRVEVLHTDLMGAHHVDLGEAPHIGLGEERRTLEEEELRILAEGEEHHIEAVEHHTVLGAVVRHTGQEEAVGHILAEVGNHLAVERIVDSALVVAGTAAEVDRSLDLGLLASISRCCSCGRQVVIVGLCGRGVRTYDPDTAVEIRRAGCSYKTSEICELALRLR